MTEQTFRIIPRTMRRSLGLSITIVRVNNGGGVVVITRSGRGALRGPAYVQVLVSATHIAVRGCDATDQDARRVNQAGGVSTSEVVPLFGLEAGERYRMEAVLDNGHLVARLPGELVERTRQRS